MSDSTRSNGERKRRSGGPSSERRRRGSGRRRFTYEERREAVRAYQDYERMMLREFDLLPWNASMPLSATSTRSATTASNLRSFSMRFAWSSQTPPGFLDRCSRSRFPGACLSTRVQADISAGEEARSARCRPAFSCASASSAVRRGSSDSTSRPCRRRPLLFFARVCANASWHPVRRTPSRTPRR